METPTDSTSIIIVTDDPNAPALTRVAYQVAHGQWTQAPAATVAPGGYNEARLSPDPTRQDGTEGSVSYTRMAAPGVPIQVSFKCPPSTTRTVPPPKNVVQVSPPGAFDVTFNEKGNPLIAIVRALPIKTLHANEVQPVPV